MEGNGRSPKIPAARTAAEMGSMRKPQDPGPVRQTLTGGTARVFLGVLIFWALVLAALPYALGYGLRYWLTHHGAERVGLVDVDFNPFTGRLALKGLVVVVDGTPVLELPEGVVRVAWSPLLKRRVEVTSLTLTGLQAVAEQRPDGTWKAPFPAPAPAPAGAARAPSRPWGFAVDGAVVNGARIHSRTLREAHFLRLTHLTLADLATWRPDRPAHLTASGALDGADLDLTVDATPFDTRPKATGRLRVRDLDVAAFRALDRGPVGALEGRLGLDLQVTARRTDHGAEVDDAGTVTLDAASVRVDGRTFRADRVAWEGKTHLGLPDAGTPEWRAEGRLEGGPATAEAPERDLRVGQRRLVWQGTLAGGPAGPFPAASGTAMVEGLRLDMPARGMCVAALQELSVDGLVLAPTGALEVERAHASGLLVGAPLAVEAAADQPPLLTVAAIQADALRRDADGALGAGTVRIDGADANLERGPDGRLRLIGARLERLAAEAAPAEAAGKAPAKAAARGPAGLPPVKVGTIVVTGDSRVHFTDRSVEPPFHATVHLTEARISDLDDTRPAAPSKVEVTARLGDYTDLKAAGAIAPFAPRATLELRGTVRRLDLPPFSAYSAGLVGYNLSSGQADADLTLRARNGVLDGQAKLTFRKLTVAPGDATRMERMGQELSMPLDAALSLLRDKDDTIRVELPVSGDLQDPALGVAGVVRKALGRGLKATAINYAKIALQPFGAVIAVVQLAGKATALRLDPVPFEAGSATLDAKGAGYAAKIASLLDSRPTLSLRVCGRAAAPDRAAEERKAAEAAKAAEKAGAGQPPAEAAPTDVRAALDALATARGEAFRDALVRPYGVAPERLVTCLPEIDPDPEGTPRVELLL